MKAVGKEKFDDEISCENLCKSSHKTCMTSAEIKIEETVCLKSKLACGMACIKGEDKGE